MPGNINKSLKLSDSLEDVRNKIEQNKQDTLENLTGLSFDNRFKLFLYFSLNRGGCFSNHLTKLFHRQIP